MSLGEHLISIGLWTFIAIVSIVVAQHQPYTATTINEKLLPELPKPTIINIPYILRVMDTINFLENFESFIVMVTNQLDEWDEDDIWMFFERMVQNDIRPHILISNHYDTSLTLTPTTVTDLHISNILNLNSITFVFAKNIKDSVLHKASKVLRGFKLSIVIVVITQLLPTNASISLSVEKILMYLSQQNVINSAVIYDNKIFSFDLYPRFKLLNLTGREGMLDFDTHHTKEFNGYRIKTPIKNDMPRVFKATDYEKSNKVYGISVVTSLTELAAKCVASFIPFELVEHVYPPVPEQLQLRIAFWSFPDNEEDIRLYSCLANSSSDEFHRGEQLFKNRAVKDPLQIGFHLSATVVCQTPRAQFNVAITFDRGRISSCNCTCVSSAYWCSHVVAVCLHRIHCSSEVCLRAPVSESLTRLQRDQLQKFAQYLISELPQQILPTAQRLLDELLSAQPTAINTVCGAPDPTAGASANDQTSWYLDEKTLHENIKRILIKFCMPAPIVFSDVNYLTNSAPPAAAEWSSLLRPLRGREPEGMWNLLSIVREMYRRCDRNAVRLLEIITEECMSCDQILVWWFQTKLSLLMGSNGYSGGKHNNTHSNSNASQHACSSLCDEIVVLWRLAALNPGLAPDERDMLHSQFTTWHLKILDRVVKCRTISTSYSSKYNPHTRSDAELFVGFKPAIEACYLDWEDYPIVGITHNQEANPIFHSPFTCFKHHSSDNGKSSSDNPGGGSTTSGQVNATMAIMSNNKHYYNQITSTDGHGLHGHLKNISSSFRDRYGNSSNSSSDSQEIGGGSEAGPSSSGVVVDVGAVGDGNRSSASSEGFCENEDFGGDSSSGNNLEGAVGFVSNKLEAVDLIEDHDKIPTRTPESESSQGSLELSTSLAHAAALSLLTSGCNLEVEGDYEEDVDREHPNTLNVNSSSKNVVNSNCSFSGTSSGGGLTSSHASFSSVSSSISSTSLAPSVLPLQAATTIDQPVSKEDMSFSSSSDEFISPVEISQDKEDAAITPTPVCSKALDLLPQPSTSVAAIASSSGRSSISNVRPSQDAMDILLARAEGLHAHGHGRDACILAVRLAEEMLANPPNLMIELPPTIPKRKGKKMNINPISHQLSALASSTLSKCAFLCTVLSENSEHYHLAFRVCLFALEMPRPPASTKPLEVKLANQESDLLALLKKIPLNQPELKVIRERAEQLRAGTLKSRGEALLPINLASFIFDALVMPSVSGKDNRNRVMSMSYRLPTDENLGFEAAVAALGLKANFSEAEYPLLCEGTRRQRGELALTLLSYYKDEPIKIARIMEKLLDRDIHVLLKTPLLPAYYSNNPPVRSAARREENDVVANLHYSSNPEMFPSDYGSVGGNSRPHSSTSAELSMSPAASNLACQTAASMAAGGNAPSTPGVSGGNSTRPKDSRFKGKRAYPSIPNQPSEASAHFMFELAKNVLTKAGGTSSTSLFTQATTSQNHHGPHRGLHMCAFQLGLFSLGLHNCVSPNWLSRTYSSHVSWIMGQAMEIGGPAISFLVDTWEGHLTPPEAANMADRASRGWDNTMIYPSAELALSVLPHAAALNPNEIQRAIIQCKENSDYMLERSCIIVENAAKGGGVYPEVLFQVARYWYELYLRTSPTSEQEHDINDVDHSVSISLSALIESQDTGAGPCPPVVVTSAPPPFQQGVAAIAPINLAHPGYHNPYTYCQAAGIYHHHNHHNLTYPANPHQMQMFISAAPPQPPHHPHPAYQFPPGPPGPPNQPPPPPNTGPPQVFPQTPNFTPQGYPAIPCNAAQMQQNMQQFYALAQVPNPNNQPNRHPGVVAGPGVYPQFGQPQQVQQATVRQRHPHQYTPTQMRYLIAAYNAGMLAMETLARRVHDDRPQAKYARNPPYGEDVKWLLRISKKLGTQYLHQFCLCAVNSLVSPFVLHDVAIESAHYLGRNNPQSAMQHLRSVLTPIVQKCQQMYIQCIHQKLYHLTQSDYEEFANIILAARAAFQITPEGNAQFKDWLQSIKRSKSCKKDLWTQINAALQSNSK